MPNANSVPGSDFFKHVCLVNKISHCGKICSRGTEGFATEMGGTLVEMRANICTGLTVCLIPFQVLHMCKLI